MTESLRGGLTGVARAGGERQLDGVHDPAEQEVALRRLELLGVLLRVGERTQLSLELAAHGVGHGLEPVLLDDRCKAEPDLGAANDVRLGRGHRDRRAELGLDLLGRARRLAQALGSDPRADPLAVAGRDLGGDGPVEDLRLAGPAPQLLLRLAETSDLTMRELERGEQRVLRDLLGAALDHRDRLRRTDDEQVEARLLELGQGRVDDQPPVGVHADAHGADRAEERQRRDRRAPRRRR